MPTDAHIDTAFVGSECEVPCVDGNRRYVDLDGAATTPALAAVASAVDALLPFYGSPARGAGYKSLVTTAALDGARAAVAELLDARDDDVVVFVRGTTEALNLACNVLKRDAVVVVPPSEHHANLLPWRRHALRQLPFSSSPAHLLASAEEALAVGDVSVLTVTGASNVTGEVWPVRELADLAHAAGARLVVDAAQLAPHRAISMRELGVDLLALSGHKLYAPYGVGVLVGRPELLADAEPMLRGGGATREVGLDQVSWTGLPQRHEAGTPNCVGAVAVGAACDALAAIGMERVAEHERGLAERLWQGVDAIDGVRRLRLWDDDTCDRLGVATLTSERYSARLLGKVLAVEHGIGVRTGRFCAHPLMAHLLGGPGSAIRASIGLHTTVDDVDRFVTALEQLHDVGPLCEYELDASGEAYVLCDHPDPDLPALPFRLVAR